MRHWSNVGAGCVSALPVQVFWINVLAAERACVESKYYLYYIVNNVGLRQLVE